MRVDEFSFQLPDELIAQTAVPRGTSRLLTLSRETGAVLHGHIGDLPGMLRAGDVLVVNDTRVFAARLLGRRVPSGGAVECLLLGAPIDRAPDGSARFEALVHPGQKLKPGAQVRFDGPAAWHRRRDSRTAVLRAKNRAADPRRTARRSMTLVDAIGHVPLAAVHQRGDEAADRERYQTVYARDRGSVAAPTAGLHFTPELLEAIAAPRRRARRGHAARRLRHVQTRSRRPSSRTTSSIPSRTRSPSETAAAIASRRAERRRVIAVGTTTTRALEDAARARRRGRSCRAGAGRRSSSTRDSGSR